MIKNGEILFFLAELFNKWCVEQKVGKITTILPVGKNRKSIDVIQLNPPVLYLSK
jgi:hypothetical protein